MTDTDNDARRLRHIQRRLILGPSYETLQTASTAYSNALNALNWAKGEYTVAKMKLWMSTLRPANAPNSPFVGLPVPEEVFLTAVEQKPKRPQITPSCFKPTFLHLAAWYLGSNWGMEVTRRSFLQTINLWKVYRTGRPGLVVLPEKTLLKAIEFGEIEKDARLITLGGHVPFVRRLSRKQRTRNWGVLFPANMMRGKRIRRVYCWWLVNSEAEALAIGFVLAGQGCDRGQDYVLPPGFQTSENVEEMKAIFL